jgi:hypothetical protein
LDVNADRFVPIGRIRRNHATGMRVFPRRHDRGWTPTRTRVRTFRRVGRRCGHAGVSTRRMAGAACRDSVKPACSSPGCGQLPTTTTLLHKPKEA